MKRILVVADESELLEVLREHFDGRYEIETALSGASAIERFVRQTDPKIPVVMVTANAENAVAVECITLGAFGYVPKPFNLTYMDHMASVAIEQAGRRPR
jgi:CheY-like chemotaxis protein